MAPAAVGAVPAVTSAATGYSPAVSRPATPATAVRRPAGAPHARRSFSQAIADYSYVPGDLRRIAILAGGLVVLLAGLSFFLR